MHIVTDISYSHNTPCVVALGCFDGVHLGHVSVIKTAKKEAERLGLPCCIWSFSEPPKRYYAPELIPILTPTEIKRDLIESLDADIYVSVKFNEDIASISPEDFFDTILLKNLQAACIVCGFDFTFGKGGKGTSDMLRRLCEANSIGFVSLLPVYANNQAVSSSAIRKLLADGDVEQAATLLGRPYFIKSKVVDGKHLGRDLGFPTINQKIDKTLCKPANGVYITKIQIDNFCHFGITNIGTQPTVGGSEIIAETNIFNFSGNLYGKCTKVEFLKFIRPEKKFASLEELSYQVHSDIETAQNFIKNITI